MAEHGPKKEGKSRGFSAHEGWAESEFVAVMVLPVLIFAFLFEDLF